MSRVPGSHLIAFATWLLALLAAGLMYGSFDARCLYELTSLALRGPVKEDDDQPAY
jgi:hypothetical protein